MKVLGLGAAGLGAAAATIPVISDLDEVTATGSTLKRDWWVKERDFKDPSVEIDWSIFEAWKLGPDGMLVPWQFGGSGQQVGYRYSEADNDYQVALAARQQDIQDVGLKSGRPGFSLRDVALSTGMGFNTFKSALIPIPWTGQNVQSPEEMGVPKWTGTPEEATSMMRAMAAQFGVYNIGVIELDTDTRKMADPGRIRFADVDEPSLEDAGAPGLFQIPGRKVVPNKAKYLLVFSTTQSTEMTKRHALSSQQLGSSHGYSQYAIQLNRLQRALKTLGYLALDTDFMDMMNVGTGVLSGIGELSRITFQITPEQGPNIRCSNGILTDLPMAPTKPIDAGIHRFCKTCKICAEVCQEANGQTPLSIETEPTWEIDGPYNRVGVKAFQIAWGRCNFCPYCMSNCPFSQHYISPLHAFISATTAITPVFNEFFANSTSWFGYGARDKDEELAEFWTRDTRSWARKGWDPNMGGSF